jgi:hypothetical protein
VAIQVHENLQPSKSEACGTEKFKFKRSATRPSDISGPLPTLHEIPSDVLSDGYAKHSKSAASLPRSSLPV